MAGKSGRGKNRKGSNNNAVVSKPAVDPTTVSKSVDPTTVSKPVESAIPSESVPNNVPSNVDSGSIELVKEANGVPVTVEPQNDTKPEEPQGSEAENSDAQSKQGELHLFAVSVKTQSGEKLELQLNPGDSVMDIRQFLLDAPESCFFTCYDLLLHTKDGSCHLLEDFNEISEVADITTGGCTLEMVPALYDDRSSRAHVYRTRDLLTLSSIHASLSTSLALQSETAQSKISSGGSNAPNVEVPELDGLGFMDDVPGSLSSLLFNGVKDVKCVESIVFSTFNPPPSYRRLVGDLLYLDVVTLEGNKHCITGTTKMFYVNSSTGNSLDPRPSKANYEATTLIGLLQKISPKFKKAFREIMERKSIAHPFESVQSMLPPNLWLGSYPIPDHKRDATRAEDALVLSYGSELIGMQRDWNEELQSCREFPHSSPQERILRDRALYKVTSDFVDAAINGAIGVINKCIPPINPTDPECFHMYVHNNIFFSFAIDADLEQVTNKGVSEKSAPKTELSNGPKCDGLAPESEEESAETEQATYASANNDLKGTKAYQEADVPGIYNLAMAIVDYRGHRVVAQSVLPGILQGDKSKALLYGSVDNGKKISWSEEFHSKVAEAAKRLHLKEHMVVDGSDNVFRLAAPVECKGIIGSDERHYLLDLMRVTPRDANYTGPGSRFCILRPELITAYCQMKKTVSAELSKCFSNSEENGHGACDDKQDKTKEENPKDVQECASAPVQTCESEGEIFFNPNVFTDFKLAGNPKEITADEERVREVSSYLVEVVLPKFVQDLCTLEVSPMDGQTLTEALHAHGINVRYLGKVTEGTRHLPHLWDICSNEIVVRSAKHIFKDVLRETEDHDLGPAISHFFNCLFGNCQGARGTGSNSQSKTPKKEQTAHAGKLSKGQRIRSGASRKNPALYLSVNSETLWSDIQQFAKFKYQFEIPEDSRARIKKVSVIRNFCLKVGVTIAARRYDLNAATPFQAVDVMNLQPVLKHSVPVCTEAKDLIETGKLQLAEGMLSEAYTLFTEAFSILQQVTGPMHREVANCCRYLAMVLYHAGDMAGAIIQQHKELIINERCLGLDHPDTAHSYGNMALFYHGLNQTELALRHMSRALLLLSLSSGPDHPDVAATFINVAMMYQDIGKMNTALRYLQEALKKNERLLGEEHIQTAVCYHALAIAFNCMGAFKLSHQHEKKTYDILVKQLGEEDSRTRDSENWMKTFKMRELQLNAQKQKGQALNATSTQKAIDILKAHPDLMQVFQAAAGAGSGSNKSLNSALMSGGGEALPRVGRGVDERAARAAAEVRKKAAARGLSIRPHGVPVQALPQLTQIINMINSETQQQQQTDQVVEEGQASAAPAGLGKGLGSLDAKKHKSKPKLAE